MFHKRKDKPAGRRTSHVSCPPPAELEEDLREKAQKVASAVSDKKKQIDGLRIKVAETDQLVHKIQAKNTSVLKR